MLQTVPDRVTVTIEH